MAFNPTACAAAMKTQMLSHPEIEAIDGAALQKQCEAIATAILTHIASTGIVVGTATGAVAGGPGVPIVGTIS